MKKADSGTAGLRDQESRFEVEILELTEVAQLTECVELQLSVWGASEADVVPVSQLRAAQHAGGLVAGARIEGELVGFCYGFPSFRPGLHEGPGLHSHMTGVAAAARSRGVGRTLKWYQRDWCLAQGLSWVEWTFDPLRAANARFNLEYLGATAGEYLVDIYGELDDELNAGMPSDRLMAHWDLGAEPVALLERETKEGATGLDRSARQGVLEAAPAERTTTPAAEPVLAVDPDGGPGEPRLASSAPAVSVSVPPNLSDLLADRPALAGAWRLASRQAFLHYLARGYRAVRFVGCAYRLERNLSG